MLEVGDVGMATVVTGMVNGEPLTQQVWVTITRIEGDTAWVKGGDGWSFVMDLDKIRPRTPSEERMVQLLNQLGPVNKALAAVQPQVAALTETKRRILREIKQVEARMAKATPAQAAA